MRKHWEKPEFSKEILRTDGKGLILVQSNRSYAEEVRKAKTVLWNGPMGIFEIPDSSKGTFAIAKADQLLGAEIL